MKLSIVGEQSSYLYVTMAELLHIYKLIKPLEKQTHLYVCFSSGFIVYLIAYQTKFPCVQIFVPDSKMLIYDTEKRDDVLVQ